MDLTPGLTVVTDFDPYTNRTREKTINVTSAYLNLIKATFGTGMLSLPIALKMQGLVMGPILMVVTTVICLYCVKLMLAAVYKVNIRTKNANITAAPASKYLLEQGAFWMKPLAPAFPTVIITTNITGQVLIVASYILFLGNTTLHLFNLYIDKYPIQIHILIVTIPVVICNFFLRDLVIVAFLSIAGNVAHITGTIISFYYLTSDLQDPSDLTKCGSAKDLLIGFGTVIFGLISVALFLSLEWNIEEPKKFLKLFGVLNVSLLFTVIVYILIGVLGYINYRENVETSYILNMPKEPLASVTVGLFGFGVFSAFFIHMYALMEMACNTYKEKQEAKGKPAPTTHNMYLFDVILRTIITIFGAIVVSIFSEIHLFIGLIGVLVMTLLSIVYPCLMHYCMVKIEYPTEYWRLIEPSILGILGLILTISGCIITCIEMVKEAFN